MRIFRRKFLSAVFILIIGFGVLGMGAYALGMRDVVITLLLATIATLLVSLWYVVGSREAAVRRYEETRDAQRDFANLVTHQLRLPISQAKWGVEVAMQDVERSTPLGTAFDDARLTLHSASTIIADLLVISQIDRQVVTPHVADLVPLHDLVEELSSRFESEGFGEVALRTGGMPAADLITDRRLACQALLAMLRVARAFREPGEHLMLDARVLEHARECEVVLSNAGKLPNELQQILQNRHVQHNGALSSETPQGVALCATKCIFGMLGHAHDFMVDGRGEAIFVVRFPIHNTATAQNH